MSSMQIRYHLLQAELSGNAASDTLGWNSYQSTNIVIYIRVTMGQVEGYYQLTGRCELC